MAIPTHPCAWGVFRGNGNGSMSLGKGGNKGNVVRPLDAGMKMFEMAQLNVFAPEVKNSGVPHFRFLRCFWQAPGLGEREVAGVWGDQPSGYQTGRAIRDGARHCLLSHVRAAA